MESPNKPRSTATTGRAAPFDWIYDVIVVGAIWLLYGPLVALGEGLGMHESPWPPSAGLAMLMLGIYFLHVVGLALKIPPQSQRLHNRAHPDAEYSSWLERWMLHGSGMILVLVVPLISQFVLWYVMVSFALEMLGFFEPGLLGLVAFVLSLAAAVLPCWSVWALINIDEGRREPFALIPGAKWLEPVGDLFLAISAVVLLVPLIALMGEALIVSVGGLLLAIIVGGVFFAAPRLPELIEGLPRWQFWLRGLFVILAVSLGLIQLS